MLDLGPLILMFVFGMTFVVAFFLTAFVAVFVSVPLIVLVTIPTIAASVATLWLRVR